jgi:NADPH-dependent glutamate synthase beta subunit-like oxidoreductase
MSFNVDLAAGKKKSSHSTGASLGADPVNASLVLRAVRAKVKIPIFVKLTPEGGRIAEVSEVMYQDGANAVTSVANRLGITPVDIRHPGRGRYFLQDEPTLSCLSGGWIRPLALRDVFEIRRRVGPKPVICGTGGISDMESVVTFAMAGADMFGVCTEILVRGFDILPEIMRDLRQYMKEMGLNSLREIRDILTTAIKSAPDLTLHNGYAKLRDPHLAAPCVDACPNAVPAQGYIRAVAKRDFRTAYKLISSADPLQRVCGLVCDRPCESACTRKNKDEPLRIRAIKRFVLDYANRHGWKPDMAKAATRSEKVAVVGSGPAGMSAAMHLAVAGYPVTVFEKENEPGGMLRWGIPRFRLPREIIDREFADLRALGVELRLNSKLSADDLRRDGYKAVVLATGTWKPHSLSVPGEDAEGCTDALRFLHDISGGKKLDLSGKRICVIGGGFTAVDAARTAVRFGAKEVFIAYRRTRDEMPAGRDEVDETEAEGVKIMYLVAPKEIVVKNGRVAALRMINHVLGRRDESGRRKPLPINETVFELPCDLIVNAVGQTGDTTDLPKELKLNGGLIGAAEETGATNLPGVWAAGDVAGAKADVIGAVASGRRAACAVDRALAGDQAVLLFPARGGVANKERILLRHGKEAPQNAVPLEPASGDERIRNWDLCEPLLTEEEAVKEAKRCYGCGCGAGCGLCESVCSSVAIKRFDNAGYECFRVDQDKCHACGMCSHLCPNQNIEMVQTG